MALIALLESVPLVKLTVAVPEIVIAAPTVNVPLDVTVTGLVVPEMAPSVTEAAAKVWMSSDFVPSVMVCPAEVKAPALRNCRL